MDDDGDLAGSAALRDAETCDALVAVDGAGHGSVGYAEVEACSGPAAAVDVGPGEHGDDAECVGAREDWMDATLRMYVLGVRPGGTSAPAGCAGPG